MSHEVSVVITCCGRPDLLKRTFASLVKFNTYPIEEYLIIEDSQSCDRNDFLLRDYPDLKIKLLYNKANIGQLQSIDKAYGEVKTPYIFHCEDDWEFYKEGFIEYSFSFLDLPNVYTCWLREDDDINGHPTEKVSIEGRLVTLVKRDRNDDNSHWKGFSLNPHLLKVENYLKMAKYSELINELDLNKRFYLLGFSSAKSEGGYVRHIGDGRSTSPDKI